MERKGEESALEREKLGFGLGLGAALAMLRSTEKRHLGLIVLFKL